MSRQRLLRVASLAALALLVLAALYAAAGFLLLPWLAQRYVPETIGQKVGREFSVQEFRVNPFLLTVEADGVRLAGDGGPPLLSIAHLAADASIRGLLRGIWTFDQVKAEGLHVNLSILPDGSLAMPALPATGGPREDSGQGRPAVRIRQLAILDAVVTLRDQRQPARPPFEIAPAELRAQDLTTIPQDPPGSYVLKAVLAQAGVLDLHGRIGSRDGGIAGSGQLRAGDVRSNILLALLAPQAPIAQLQARLDLSAAYAHAPSIGLLFTQLEAVASGVQATLSGAAQPLLQAKKLAVHGGEVDVARRAVRLQELMLAGGKVHVAAPGDTAAPPASGAGRAWNVDVAKLRVDGVDVAYGATGTAHPALVDAASVSGQARVHVEAGDGPVQVRASGLEASSNAATLRMAAPAAATVRTGPVSIAGASFDLRQHSAAAERVRVQDAVFPGNANATLVRLGGAELSGAHLDWGARRFAAKSAVVTGEASLVRDATGSTVLPRPATARRSVTASDAGPAWRYQLDTLKIPSFGVLLRDDSVKPPLQVRGTLRGTARNLSTGATASFDARAELTDGASVKAAGTVVPDAGRVQARLAIGGVGLRQFQPLLAAIAPLELRSGVASGSGELRYAPDAGLSVDADLGIDDLRVDEAATSDRLLSCSRLDLIGGTLDLEARRFTVRRVDVRQPGAKIVVSQDRHLNLLQVLGKDNPAGRQARQATGARNYSWEIGEVRLHQGEVDFADHSLVLPFSTKVTGVDGTVAGLSNDPARSAAVQIDGAIQPYGSAQLRGSFVPAAPTRSMDLQARFENMRMAPLSPYTATFAGRKVESGKLWLDLGYRMEDGQLRGSNDIRLEDFTLGERVDAPSAVDVPLDLVVALLADENGRIKLSVPVTGEVGDAHFSVASAVKQALGNVLRRVVTAPFRALTRVFGRGDGTELATVRFDPGSAGLRPQARESLDALANAMRSRPLLDLVIPAPYAPQLDAHALQESQARRGLARELGRPVGPDEEPGATSLDDPATRGALERMLQAASGNDALRQLQDRYAQGSHALYRAIFEAVVAAQPLDAQSPRLLAVERARAISQYLRQQGIAGSRVRTGKLSTVEDGADGGIAAELEVAAASGR